MQKQQREISEALTLLRPKRSMLSDDVYEPIKRLIMDNVVAPGERIGIDYLARELGVSPTPVREALARLEAEDLVTKEPLRGYRTTKLLTRDQIDQLFEMRALIEPWAAEQTALRASTEERLALEREVLEEVQVPVGEHYADYGVLTAHDQRFHEFIAEASGNTFVASAFRAMNVHLHLFRLHYGRSLGAFVPTEHGRIVEAIVAGDGDAAAQAMADHVNASRQRIIAVFGENDESADTPKPDIKKPDIKKQGSK